MEARGLVRRRAVTCRPDTTLIEASQRMRAEGVGSVLVLRDSVIVGIVTDRDISVRGLAEGLGPTAKVESVMSHDVQYVFEDTDLFTVAGKMATTGYRRMPVLSSDNGLIGVISLDDLIMVFAEQIRKLGAAVRKEITHAPA